MKINKLIFILFTLSLVFTKTQQYKITKEENRKIRQAKALYNNGLINEASDIYYEILKKSPYLKEAYSPYKNILKKNNNWDLLLEISNSYLISNNNSIQAKVEILDALIWINNESWIDLTKEIINTDNIKDRYIKLTLNVLLNNNKYDYLDQYLQILRQNKSPDFYSYEMGMHYSINFNIQKSIDEFLLHIKYNSNRYSMIKNRILAYPNIKNAEIKNYLTIHNSNISKLILADIEFSENNLSESYRLLKTYSNNEKDLIEFTEDLINIKEYEFAQNVLDDLLNASTDKNIIQQSIVQLAKIFEQIILSNKYNLPISNKINKNDLLESPFIKINQNKLSFLKKAISIYDSLRININDIESTYHLAEIKYRILGDLDEANSLYASILKNKNYNSLFYKKSIIKMIDILISKGDLNQAYDILKENRHKLDNHIYASKESQILFYQNNWDILNKKNKNYLKKNTKDNIYYNDILKITNNVLLFDQDTYSLDKYSKALLKLFQNKRVESLEILQSLNNNNNIEIRDKINYEYAYSQLKQGLIEDALITLNQDNNDTAYNESKILLKGEIYDYILDDKIKAIDVYLYFLDNFPDSIYYDSIRLRLRELAS